MEILLVPNELLRQKANRLINITSEDIKRVARRIFLGDSNADSNANHIKLITVIAGDPNGF